jgi:hypothetical protein
MELPLMSLTDTAIKALKPAAKPRKVFDGNGLYLEVSPAGGKWWRLKYYSPVTRKEKRLSLGVYPGVTLRTARQRCGEARKQLADGVDPGIHRRREKLTKAHNAANAFEAVTRDGTGNSPQSGQRATPNGSLPCLSMMCSLK